MSSGDKSKNQRKKLTDGAKPRREAARRKLELSLCYGNGNGICAQIEDRITDQRADNLAGNKENRAKKNNGLAVAETQTKKSGTLRAPARETKKQIHETETCTTNSNGEQI
jgi:hypothetical protein